MNGELSMAKRNFFKGGLLPDQIKDNIHGYVCKHCFCGFLASTEGAEKWATDITNLKICPHCGENLYEIEDENRTIQSENRTNSSE